MSRHRLLSRERRDRRKFARSVAGMGAALAEIRDGRLYEAEGYEKFEDWCAAKFQSRWPLTPAQVEQLIAASLELAAKRVRKAGDR